MGARPSLYFHCPGGSATPRRRPCSPAIPDDPNVPYFGGIRMYYSLAARISRRVLVVFALVGLLLAGTGAFAQAAPASTTNAAAAPSEAGGEASLKLPDLSSVQFLGTDGHTLLLFGLIICALGMVFG